VSLVELARIPSRAHAEELQFVLQGGGVPAVVLPAEGPGNGSRPWCVMVPEGLLARARQILAEEDPPRQATPITPPRRVPLYWTVMLMVLNVLVWIAMEGRGGSERQAVLLRFGASQATRLRTGQWWRSITATLIHIGGRHLLANMITLLVLGPAVMESWGVGRAYFMYLAAGVAGNWVSFVIWPSSAVKAGASGCILGLLGVLAGTRIRSIRAQSRTGPLGTGPLLARSRFKTWHIVAMLVAFYGFVIGVGQVDHLAHIGGLLTGLLLALTLPTPPHTGRDALGLALGGAAAITAVGGGLLAYLHP